MTLNALQALTWSTIAGAVVGALLLASSETNFSRAPREHQASGTPGTNTQDAGLQRVSQDRAPLLIDASLPKRELAVR